MQQLDVVKGREGRLGHYVLGFGQEELAHGVRGQWIGHERANLARQTPAGRDKGPTASRQIGEKGKDRRVAAVDVVDEEQHGAPTE